MINGIVYDFESIKAMLPTGLLVLMESISWKDKKDDEVITGVAGLPVGIGRGEYSGECEIEFSLAEYEALNLAAAASGGFYNMPPVPVVVAYGHLGQPPFVDTLLVHFTERDKSGSKGDKSLNVTIKGALCAPAIDNGVPAYIPE
jgi:hypothetical protein